MSYLRHLFTFSFLASTIYAESPLPFTVVDIAPADLQKHVTYLASDALQGRLTGTEGERLATQYAADVLKSYGLQGYGLQNSWFQEFEFTAGVALGSHNRLNSKDQTWKLDMHWRPLSFSQIGEVADTGIVFAGYGIETPDDATGDDGKKLEPYSSYAHLEVKDQWVMVLRYLPEGIDQARRNVLNRYSSLRHKALTARQKGARGLIVVSGPNSKVVDQLAPLSFDASLASSGITAISITDAVASDLLQRGAGKSLQDLQTQLDTGALMGGIILKDIQLGAQIDIVQEKKTGRNVLAVLPAKEQPDPHTPPVMLGAHIDHLGNKAGSNSRAKGDEKNLIHHGADDNASGVAGVLEIAQWLTDLKKQGKLSLKRDIIFALWSGEELGLLGSNAFADSMGKMIFGKADAKLGMMFSAYLNMDMIGRFDKTLVLQAVGSSTWWPKEIEKRNAPIGLPITTQNDPHLPTDSSTFYLRGVPTLSAFTGSHADYHLPSDTAEKINYDRAAQIAKLIGLITRSLAIDEKKPDYQEMQAPKNQGTRGGMRVYLGTIPDYSQGDVKGVKLSGVSSIGPAAKAGVKGGDIIIKLGSKDILNIYDYTSLMGELKVGKPTTITVLREGKEVELQLVPGSRE